MKRLFVSLTVDAVLSLPFFYWSEFIFVSNAPLTYGSDWCMVIRKRLRMVSSEWRIESFVAIICCHLTNHHSLFTNRRHFAIRCRFANRQSPFANRRRFGKSPLRGEILFMADATPTYLFPLP